MILLIKRLIFYFRTKGLKGSIEYFKLHNFEKKIFSNKKLIWNNLGFWETNPKPTDEELERFYSKIYWLNNKYYKERLLIPRDIDHFLFLKEKLYKTFDNKINFLNFGAGHGGISFLFAVNNSNVFNVEPTSIFNPFKNQNNFLNFNELIEYNKKNNIFFDLIYSSHTIEHIIDPIDFFKKSFSILKKDGKMFIEVPNCRRSKKDLKHLEGGYDGKIIGSHLIYFTKDFFENFNSNIFFFKEEEGGEKYTEVYTEDDADCIRAIIKAENINNWLIKSNLN